MPTKISRRNPKDEAVPVKLVWDSGINLETIYVNHAAIIHNGPEFYLVFGELAMPVIRNKSEVPKELHIIPKVRLAISPDQIKAIADVIFKNANLEIKEKIE